MKKILIFFLLMISIACTDDDNNDMTNLIGSQWNLVSLNVGNALNKPDLENYRSSNAYMLSFIDSSTFQFDTGSNLSKGFYSLSENDQISISDYHEFTEVAASRQEEKKLNTMQIELFNQVENFKLSGNSLIIFGEAFQFVFKRAAATK